MSNRVSSLPATLKKKVARNDCKPLRGACAFLTPLLSREYLFDVFQVIQHFGDGAKTAGCSRRGATTGDACAYASGEIFYSHFSMLFDHAGRRGETLPTSIARTRLRNKGAFLEMLPTSRSRQAIDTRQNQSASFFHFSFYYLFFRPKCAYCNVVARSAYTHRRSITSTNFAPPSTCNTCMMRSLCESSSIS